MLRYLLATMAFLFVSNASAGFIEFSVSGSYKRTNFAESALQTSQSLTGSVSYYFAANTAIELSYTDGYSKTYLPSTTSQDYTTWTYYSMLGADFVLTLGEKGALLNPYVKAGVGRLLSKRIVEQYEGFAATERKEEPATVPSAGIGVKLNVTKTLAIKLGFDAWSSGSLNKEPVKWDYFGRAGVSWLF